MSRKPRVQRTPEEKWQIVLEVLEERQRSAETCRKYEIAPRFTTVGKTKWKKEPRLPLWEAQPRGPMWSRSSGSSNPERALGRSHLQIEIGKNVQGEASRGQAHSSARELVAQGKEAKLVAEYQDIIAPASTIGGNRPPRRAESLAR